MNCPTAHNGAQPKHAKLPQSSAAFILINCLVCRTTCLSATVDTGFLPGAEALIEDNLFKHMEEKLLATDLHRQLVFALPKKITSTPFGPLRPCVNCGKAIEFPTD